jgi:thymidylate kinase
MDNSRDKLLKNMLLWLFDEYEKKSIPYLILRNYKELPEKNIGSDIDILIDRHYKKKNKIILLKMAECFNLKLLPIIKREYVTTFKFFKLFDDLDYFCIKLDFVDGAKWKGINYLPDEELFKKKLQFKMFYILHPIHEAIISWLTRLLDSGTINMKHKNFILKTAKVYERDFYIILKELLGKKLINILWPLIISERLEDTISHSNKIKFALRAKAFKNAPFKSLIEYLLFYWYELRLRINPSGIIVAFIGPDGSGKSTTANKLVEILKKIYPYNDDCYIYWRPGIFPLLGDLFRLEKREFKGPCTNPHAAKPSGFLFSLIRLFYYTIDYIIGYPLKILPKTARNYMIIFDRYYYDFIIDPYRSRIKLPRFIPYLITKFIIPKPDAVIYLDNNPDTLIKRKQEVPIEELERQVTAYRDLVSKLPNGHIINGDRALKDIVHEAASLILEAKAIDNKHELSRIQ